MKRTFMLLLLGIISFMSIHAQTKTVTGTVTSSEDGQPIIGASVVIPGSTTGGVTDLDGRFSINIPTNATQLQFSYIGMQTVVVAIRNNMHVVMHSEAAMLDEVVVTALGITRSEKTLGFAASTIKSDEISAGKSGSVMAGLAGKVAGVNVSTTGPAGVSQKVIIRGISSINNNSPLYIVDGSPIDNTRFGGNTADYGNGANAINAEDVENVTILKGASATALYGSRAANGVIMITTKRAKNERLTVSYDGSFFLSNVARVMQTQDLFGQGWGSWDRAENGSWGPRLDGLSHDWGSNKMDLDGDGKVGEPEDLMYKPYSYVKNNLRDFYQTGKEMNNVVSVRFGTENLGIIASYGNFSSTGVLPNNSDTNKRNTFSLRANAKNDKFSFAMSMNYVRQDTRRVTDMEIDMLQHPVDVPFAVQKDYNDVRFNMDNHYTFYATNSYWWVDNNYNKFQSDRIYGNVDLSYEIVKGLKATGRLSGDFNNQRRKAFQTKTTFTPGSYSDAGGGTPQLGYYENLPYNYNQIDAMAFLSADYRISDFSLGGTLGWNLNQRGRNYLLAVVDGQDLIGWYDVQNTTSAAVTTEFTELRRLIGAYATADLGWKDKIFLNLSARNDWSSTLPPEKNSYFYGGANLSVLFTELFPVLKEEYKTDFMKARIAVGQTGNDANPYLTTGYYSPYYSGYTRLPLNGVSGLTLYNRMGNLDLSPEITTEYEAGLNGSFFGNRLSFDFAYYHRTTKDQIIGATLAPETGYTSQTLNVGKLQNQGVELMVSGTPVRTRDWEWDITGTFTKNWSKVIELWGGKNEYIITAGGYTSMRGVELVLIKGQPIGQLRIPAPNRVGDPSYPADKTDPYYGYDIISTNGWPTASNTEKMVIGQTQPDFIVGLTTSLKYKDLRLSIVGDWHKGGWMYSETAYITHFNGNSTQTVFNERRAYIFPHSVKSPSKGVYVENNIMVSDNNMNYAQGNYSYNPYIRQEFVLPRDYFKIREMTLTYDMPKSLISKTPFSKVTVGLVGRNLLMFTPKANNYVDPEVSNYGNDIDSEFGETTGYVSSRNIGATVKLEF